MNARGFSLIEQMIVVAIIGISCSVAGFDRAQLRLAAHTEVEHELALVALQHHADAVANGRAVAAPVAERLLAPLDEPELSVERGGGVQTLTLRWTDPFGRAASRSLTVFAGGAR